MSKVTLIQAHEHYDQVSMAASASGSNDLLTSLAIAVAIMLMVFALGALRNVVAEFWSLVRSMFSSIRAAAFSLAALLVLTVVLVAQVLRG